MCIRDRYKSMQQPQGASIWGNINTCVEIALNVYYIYAEHGEGIVIGKEKADQTVSAKAIEAGNEEGEYLYYGKDNTMDIPLYEIPVSYTHLLMKLILIKTTTALLKCGMLPV